MSRYPLFPPLAVPALVLTLVACSSGEPENGEDASVEIEESATDEDGADGKEDSEDSEQTSLGDPGVLMAECGGGSGAAVTLFSAEDGSELHSASFSTGDIDHAESEDLSHGRVAPGVNVSLADPCEEDTRAFFPERGLVVGTFQEEVNGNNISGFGVLDENGTFTALSPDQEVSDFDTPTDYLHPVGDPEGGRILFLEDDREDDPTIQSLDLESGEITDIGTCEYGCTRLTVMPGIDGAVLEAASYHDLIPVLDGSAVIGSKGSENLYFLDLEDQAEDDLVDLQEAVGDPVRREMPKVVAEGSERIRAIDDNTLIFEDNVLSVWEFTAETFEDHESENEDVPMLERDPLPAERTLVPEGTRENSDPHVSPDSTEVLFRSSPPTGGTTWYKVPVDGSSEPEEFPDLALHTVLAWQ